MSFDGLIARPTLYVRTVLVSIRNREAYDRLSGLASTAMLSSRNDMYAKPGQQGKTRDAVWKLWP